MIVELIQEMMVLYGFAIIGFTAMKFNILNKSSIDVLSKLILNVTLPCLIIHSLDKTFTFTMLKDFIWLLLISLYVLAVATLLAHWMGKRLQHNKNKRATYESLIIFGNQGFIGYAVVMALFGEEEIIYLVIFNIFYLILIWTYGIYLFTKNNGEFTIKGLLNSGLMSTIIGIIILLLPIKLNFIISKTLEEVGNITVPLSMIFIGSLLAVVKYKDLCRMIKDIYIWLATILRLIAIPILVLPFLYLSIHPKLIMIAFIVSGMPSAPTTSLYAQKYGGDIQFSSIGVLLSTVLSLITIPLLISIIKTLIKV
ncbi:AEC family transporter [Ornithinibacillus sp. 4-3]|uniref:AEC family transporter n=1 Tax=Ornithinibacillus sp. 4-3 TaxID=3231488 RepID=A0AB39HS07_9BACI